MRHKDYKTKAEIELKSAEIEAKRNKTLKIELEVEKLKQSPTYLTDHQVKICTKMIADIGQLKSKKLF